VRFVPQGRDPAHGLDCVGLVGHAFGAAGADIKAPGDYRLRGGSAEHWRRAVARACLVEIDAPRAHAGDLLLMRVGPGQFHLGVHSGRGMIHAHAGVRRVVETLGVPAWPVVGVWRLAGKGD
jgi:lipoprotein Spr